MGQVRLTEDAMADFARLPRAIQARVIGIFQRLEQWPAVSGAKPLSANLKGAYRIRTGDYRVQFRFEGATVVVVKIGHRARFYED
jgi:mRNA-degrading endonuclease RelE of RelBE toxin-antitoxin system